jgi:putative ABC transport system permease protein
MSWFETVRTGLGAITTHRLRSALTMLGIMIGIAAVILTVGLGQGAQNQVTSQINALGTNLLTVSPGSSTSSSGIRQGFGSASTLTQADATALSSKTNTWTTSVGGTTPVWETVRNRSITQGRFIDNQDVTDHTAVAVLGSATASQLFGNQDPVGQTITMQGVPLTVIGVLNSVGSTASTTGTNQDDQVLVPITTATERILGTTSLSSILIQANSGSSLSSAYQEANAELLKTHNITTPASADFTIASEQSLVTTATSVSRTLTILLGGVAALSLLVGGIGVMNIMLVSVTERVKEIGLRKALGAKPALIRRQFLLEASMLGVCGGALGAGLALIGTSLLPKVIGYPIAFSGSATAAAVAVAIGMVFGVYPATRAAQLAPIEALRSE